MARMLPPRGLPPLLAGWTAGDSDRQQPTGPVGLVRIRRLPYLGLQIRLGPALASEAFLDVILSSRAIPQSEGERRVYLERTPSSTPSRRRSCGCFYRTFCNWIRLTSDMVG
jgi:hypothetical protein